MAEALDPTAYVFEGVWTDWTQGRIQGLTWTLCPTKATLLTNSLALFVTLAGGQLWTIIRFSLHQVRASRRPHDHSQSHLEQQIVLRNTATDLHTMRLMAHLAWLAQRTQGGIFSYPLAIVTLAILHYILFVVAGTLSNTLVDASSGGLFSNKLQNTSSPVISRSPYCGVWNSTYYGVATNLNGHSLEDISLAVQYIAKIDQNVQLSLQYAQECSEDQPDASMSATCNTLQTPRLKFNTNITEVCPFETQLCHDQAATVTFDTGVIDSHHDLGINARHNERLQYRRLTTCTVLNDTGRVLELNKDTSSATAAAYYGQSYQGTTYTYSYSNYSSLYTEFTPQSTVPYQVNTQTAYGASLVSENESTFVPIPGLAQRSADLTLLFLSFTGRYFNQINDPWFSAQNLHLVNTQNPLAQKQYARDRLISTLGCTEQHQFCTTTGSCSEFLGWGQLQDASAFNAALTPHQNVTFDRMLRAVRASGIAQVTRSLGRTSKPLLAMQKEASQGHTMSLWLPDNQWQLELHSWHTIAMAQLQRTVVQWTTGQIAPHPQGQLLAPGTEPDSWFCGRLKIRSIVFQSFSVLYLSLIIFFGTLVILTSWFIEDMTGWFQLRCSKGTVSRKIWDEDHILRLRKYVTRTSWKPRPPPKDHTTRIQPLQASEEVILIAPSPVYPLYGSLNHSDRWPRFPRFHMPLMRLDMHQNPINYSPPRVSTPRLWSKLPPEPPRDSWVGTHLNYYDPPERETSKDFLSGGASRPPKSALESSNGTKPLELSNLRAHALARAHNQKTRQSPGHGHNEKKQTDHPIAPETPHVEGRHPRPST